MSLLDLFRPPPQEPTVPMLAPNPDDRIQRTPEDLELIANWQRSQK